MNKPLLLGLIVSLNCAAGLAAEEGLVGHWRFDKPGPKVADLSGRGHPASLSGGKIVRDDGRDVLALDGTQKIVVPSSPELNLARGFTIEARLRFDRIGDGHTLVYKDRQYGLRVDWKVEGNKLSFFPCAGGDWEPRVSALVPETGRWHHVVATWNGRESAVWLNGEPFQTARSGNPPAASDSPLVIASDAAHGPGVRGAIDYVKIYRRALSAAEILRRAYGVEAEGSAAGRKDASFDFSKAADAQGWSAGPGAEVRTTAGQLVVSSRLGRGLALQKNLQVDVSKRDYLNLRLTAAAGSRGEVVFVTTQGAGRIPFEIVADGKPHAYVLEPWTWAGWGGTLLALAVVPSDAPATAARLDYLRVTAEPEAEPELRVADVFSESALPRAGRTETIVARVKNVAGPAAAFDVRLSVPEGVRIEGAASQRIERLGYLDEREVTWKVAAERPVDGEFGVAIGDGQPAASQRIAFTADPRLAKADYVPRPVPADTGKYTLWTHYCPLWKAGTHTGWKAIEPWPQRKPVLGWYNEGDPAVADWHIKMMLEHGIRGSIYCWYRTNKNAPVQQSLGHAIHDGLLKARYLPMIRFAIMWENGCGQGCGSAEDLLDNLLPFWIENYFSNPSYLRVDGKPVLYIWVPSNVTRDLGSSQKVRKTFERMRAVCRDRGLGGLEIVGCIGSQDRQALQAMAAEGWDASGSYGNGWRQPAQVRTVGDFIAAPVEGFIDQQDELWRFKRDLHLLPDIPSAMMGWDSRPWNETPFFWSENTPEKFRELCKKAKKVLDSQAATGPFANTLTFCCWNEFGEGHYIEPTRAHGYTYLDVIREVFCEGLPRHVDLAPEDVGLGPYDSWHQRLRTAPKAAVTDPKWAGPDLAGWSGQMGIEDLEEKGGVLRFRTTTGDPAVQSPALKVRASRYTKLVVEMRASRAGDAQVFWTTSSMPGMSETASVHATFPADGKFHPVVFDLAAHEHWGGCVTAMRLDPISAAATIEIRSIRLE
jgi:hypothetical protein